MIQSPRMRGGIEPQKGWGRQSREQRSMVDVAQRNRGVAFRLQTIFERGLS